MKIFRIPKISRKSIIVLSEFRYAALGDISPPLENIPPPSPSFCSVQVERPNMTARTENNEACKEYFEILLEEKRTCIYDYEYC